MGPLDVTLQGSRLCRSQAAIAGTRQLGLLAVRAAVVRIPISVHLASRLDLGQLGICRQLVVDLRQLGRRQARHGVRDLRCLGVPPQLSLRNRLTRHELLVAINRLHLVTTAVIEASL